jgi:hypothetical protein
MEKILAVGECPFPARYCAVKAFEEDIELFIAKIAGEVVD